MVNTLRITSVAALLIAALVLVSILGPWHLVSLGMKSDARLDRILAEPNETDKSKTAATGKAANGADQDSPLVKEATVFQKIITPKLVAAVRDPNNKPLRPIPQPQPVGPTLKFTLIGLSYSATRPEESFAYVRIDDGSVQWVRKGDEIGHSTIQEIGPKSIVCLSGGSESEIKVTEPPKTASLLDTPTGSTPASEKTAATDKPVADARAQRSPGNNEALKLAAEEARELQRTADSGEPNDLFRKREAVMKQLALGLRGGQPGPGPEGNEPKAGLRGAARRSGYRSSVIAPPSRRGN